MKLSSDRAKKYRGKMVIFHRENGWFFASIVVCSRFGHKICDFSSQVLTFWGRWGIMAGRGRGGAGFRWCEQSVLTLIKLVVHFFDTRQRNEPKKTCAGVAPLRTPCFACYTQKTLSHFLLNTRGLSRVQTLLSPPQKGRRKHWDFLRREMRYLVGLRLTPAAASSYSLVR